LALPDSWMMMPELKLALSWRKLWPPMWPYCYCHWQTQYGIMWFEKHFTWQASIKVQWLMPISSSCLAQSPPDWQIDKILTILEQKVWRI
jgi:hypothetical protein